MTSIPYLFSSLLLFSPSSSYISIEEEELMKITLRGVDSKNILNSHDQSKYFKKVLENREYIAFRIVSFIT